MKKLVIFGASQFAKIAHFYFSDDSDYEVAAFAVDEEHLEAPEFQGLPVVPFEEVERSHPPDDHDMFVAVGIGNVNRQRAAKVVEAEAKGYRLASFVSTHAGVSGELHAGPNTMVMEGVGVQPFVEIGSDTIVWSGTRIGFNTRIGDHCWIVCAAFGESVTVGDHTFIGINATIAPNLSIGKGNVIGAGALIDKDTGDFEVYKGRASSPLHVPSNWLRKI